MGQNAGPGDHIMGTPKESAASAAAGAHDRTRGKGHRLAAAPQVSGVPHGIVGKHLQRL